MFISKILGKEYIKIIPLGSVFYPSVNYLRKSIMENEICIDKFKEGNVIIIDCSKLVKTDFTMAKVSIDCIIVTKIVLCYL